MVLSKLALFFVQMVLLAISPMLAAQPRAEYGANLAALYGEYQWVLAVRETCNKRRPERQAEIDAALGIWRDRHKALIDDMEEHVGRVGAVREIAHFVDD